jgi:8-oxo-dGTP diphosphatase
MSDWQDVREFGTLTQGLKLVLRPSAYGFLQNRSGRIAVVRSDDGTYLPGGGIDAGETPEDALVREALEECGLAVKVGPCVIRATQFVTRMAEQVCVAKRSSFFSVTIVESQPDAVHPGHETFWLGPDAAKQMLSHESQKWAIDSWLHQLT